MKKFVMKAGILAVMLMVGAMLFASTPNQNKDQPFGKLTPVIAKVSAGWCCPSCGFCNPWESEYCLAFFDWNYIDWGWVDECDNPQEFCGGCTSAKSSKDNGGIDKAELSNATSSNYP